MNVSLNWLKQYIDIPLTADEVSALLTDIGLEVEGMELVESIPGGLAGVLVGEVVSCQRHPNADKLSLTQVNIGTGELLSIVCGAPNVAQGQKVMVATVGTTLNPYEGEPITLKKTKIRGETSEGMICAEDELGIGPDHSGILVLPADTPLGMPARDYFHLETDYIFEVNLTPNRSDATNHLGVARDLAAALHIHHGYMGGVRMPAVDAFTVHDHSLPVEVVVENTEACPRYSGVTIAGVKIGESPDWLKNRLLLIGVRPINNVVDITNFVLHELGQPLHAFDLSAIGQRKVVVKTLPAGSTFLSLDEQERKLFAEDLMICDGNAAGMCIGGVFGGISSGVKDTTTDIFLESAHFNAEWIRRSSMRHNLRTDAAKVFEKGSDPNITVYALKRAALLMVELAGGRIASEIIDIYPNPVQPRAITVRYPYVQGLIGVAITPADIQRILEAQGMTVRNHSDGETFTVSVPTNKADVIRPADIVEEVLRIYGFNNVPLDAKMTTTMAISPQPDPAVVRNTVADLLAANGFFEMMAVSLSQSRYYSQLNAGIAPDELVFINNTSNVHLDIMRPEMLVSGLETVLHNQNRQQTRLRLFEFGKSYRHAAGNIVERSHLSLFVSGERWTESWLFGAEKPSTFYTLKAAVEQILQRLGLNSYQLTDTDLSVTFTYGLRLHRGPQTLVELGRVHPAILREMGIRGEVFAAVFAWDTLLEMLSKQRISYREVSRYPTVRRDLALVIDNSIKFSDIVTIANKVGKKLITNINLFDVYENEAQLGVGKRSYAVSYLFENPERTLQDKEVDQVMAQLISKYQAQLGAHIRR